MSFFSLWKSLSPNAHFSQANATHRKRRRGLTAPAAIEVLEDRLLLFVLSGNEWPGGSTGTTVTYSYANLLDGNLGGSLTATELRAAVEEALTLWAAYAPLHFVEQVDSGPAPGFEYSAAGHPQIRFSHLYIDGTTGNANDVLAETFSPGTTGLSGDSYYDTGNTWTLDPNSGFDFLEVAVHEIGHALGLEHQAPASQGGVDGIMNPGYAGRYSGLGTAFLQADDINGIRFLYGTGTGSVTPLTGNSGDDHANSATSATVVSIDSTEVGNIETGGDSDWFQFSAVAGTQYTFETHLGTLNDSTLRLLAQDGVTSLAFDDDSGEGKASKITWTATATGTFFLEVEAFLSTETGTYMLDVTHNDDHGGTAAGATPLTLDVGQSGFVGVVSDQDWFSLNVTAGQTYRILLDDQGISHGRLTLYASDGSTGLLTGNGQGAGTDPWLIFTADSTGTMYVSAKGDSTQTGAYTISYTTVGGLVATTPSSSSQALVRVLNASNGAELFSYVAYGAFDGGAHIAMGDVNGDGIADVITGAGSGAGPHVRVVSGANGADLMSFFPYDMAFNKGVRVASADVNGDGKDDVITGPGAGGGPHVRVFQGSTGTVLYDMFPFAIGFTGGVYVAGGDVNGDGKADIIAGAGAGGGPHVRVISGADGVTELHSFFPYVLHFTGGVFVAAGDINGDGKADIVTGAGAGGGPHVRAFDGVTGAEIRSLFPYDFGFTGGVRVGASDVNGDGQADIITGPGQSGGPDVRVYSGATQTLLLQVFPYEVTFTGGVFLDGAPAALPVGASQMTYFASASEDTSHEAPSVVGMEIPSLFPFAMERANLGQSRDANTLYGLQQILESAAMLVPSHSEDDSEETLSLEDDQPIQSQDLEEVLALPTGSLADVFGDKLFEELSQ